MTLRARLIEAQLSAAEAEEFLGRLRTRRFERGEKWLRRGQCQVPVAWVAAGCMRVYATDTRGREHTFQFAVAGQWTGDLQSTLEPQAATRFEIEALHPAELWLLEAVDLRHACRATPRLGTYFRQLYERAYVQAQNRLISIMSESAAQRYARFLAEFPETRLQVPDRHIASYLGITPETLSRVRRRAAQASGAPGERGRRS